MVPEVKAEKIVAQQSFEELFLPGENAKGLCVWPGNVPELRDDQILPAILQVFRQQPEVIVLDENDGRPVTGLLHHGVGEDLVDLAVSLPLPGIEVGSSESDVAKRP